MSHAQPVARRIGVIALANGTFQVFSSDHAPTRYVDAAGNKLHGEGAPVRDMPDGVPRPDTRIALLYSPGALEGRINAQQFVALTAANVARLYGRYPHEGTIAIGAGAPRTAPRDGFSSGMSTTT